MTRQFGLFLGLFSLCVSAAWGAERTRVASCPSPTIVVPHPLPTIPVALPRPPLAERGLSPIEHIRRAADHLEAGAVGPIAEQLCDQADHLRKLADDLEKDAAARLAELRMQLSEIQKEIRKLEQLADPTEKPQTQVDLESPPPAPESNRGPQADATQIQVDIEILEIDMTKVKQLGIEVEILTGDCGDVVKLVSATQEQPRVCTLVPQKQAACALDALREQGFAKVLAQPSLITTSGRAASIHIGGDFPVVVPSDAGTGRIERRKFGVMAEVVALVLDNGKLRLDIAPEISEPDFSHSVKTDSGVIPGIRTRRVNTQVVMDFGQTLVIGGMTSKESGTVQGIPIASKLGIPIANKLPYFNKLFTAVPTEKRLVILATPKRVNTAKN